MDTLLAKFFGVIFLLAIFLPPSLETIRMTYYKSRFGGIILSNYKNNKQESMTSEFEQFIR